MAGWVGPVDRAVAAVMLDRPLTRGAGTAQAVSERVEHRRGQGERVVHVLARAIVELLGPKAPKADPRRSPAASTPDRPCAEARAADARRVEALRDHGRDRSAGSLTGFLHRRARRDDERDRASTAHRQRPALKRPMQITDWQRPIGHRVEHRLSVGYESRIEASPPTAARSPGHGECARNSSRNERSGSRRWRNAA